MSGYSELYDSNHAGSSCVTTPEQRRAAGLAVADRALREGWDRDELRKQLDMLGLLDAHPTRAAS